MDDPLRLREIEGRRRAFTRAASAALAAAAAALIVGLQARPARGDLVYVDGMVDPVEGRVVREAERVVIQVEGGQVSFDAARVVRIERCPWEPRARGDSEAGPTPATGRATDPASEAASSPSGGGGVEADTAALVERARATLEALDDPTDRQVRAKALGSDLARTAPAAAIAASLAVETDPTLASMLESALAGAEPSPVVRRTLVGAVERRRFASDPALLRAAAAHGGVEAARALVRLVEDAERARFEAERAGEPDRVDALTACCADGLRALGCSADPVSARFLFERVVKAHRDGEAEGGADLRAAAVSAVWQASAGGEGRDAVMATAAAALADLDGDALIEVLDGLRRVRSSALLDAIAGVLARPVLEQGPKSDAVRLSAARALQPYLDSEEAPDPRAVACLVDLLRDPSEPVRHAAVGCLALAGDPSLVGSRLIEVYERDPSKAVRMMAHRALVRLADGENRGDPEAWREWLRRR